LLATVVRCTALKEPPSGTRPSLSVSTKRRGYVINSRTVTFVSPNYFFSFFSLFLLWYISWFISGDCVLFDVTLGTDLDRRHGTWRTLRRSSIASN
jgi:hypothetical protein